MNVASYHSFTSMCVCTLAVPLGSLEGAAAAARPRGRGVAMLSCAGAYQSGADGSNECLAGYARIEDEAACRTLAPRFGKSVGSPFVQTVPYYPRGCYYLTMTWVVYFNNDLVGGGFQQRQLLCAALATGAPLHADARVDWCTGSRVRRDAACTRRYVK